MAQFNGAALPIAVAAATLGEGRLRVTGGTAAVLAGGVLVPPTGSAVVHLSAFWFAAVGVRLAAEP